MSRYAAILAIYILYPGFCKWERVYRGHSMVVSKLSNTVMMIVRVVIVLKRKGPSDYQETLETVILFLFSSTSTL